MTLQCFYHCFGMFLQWFHNGFIIVFGWFCNSMVLPWFCNGFTMVLYGFATPWRDFAMVLLWFWYGFGMGFIVGLAWVWLGFAMLANLTAYFLAVSLV